MSLLCFVFPSLPDELALVGLEQAQGHAAEGRLRTSNLSTNLSIVMDRSPPIQMICSKVGAPWAAAVAAALPAWMQTIVQLQI
jgi:hypothetical protein